MNAPRLKNRLLSFCLLSFLNICLLTPSLAQTLSLQPGTPSSYVVTEGDTLWDVAAVFLQEPWRWPEIWQANPAIENPDLIYPGDILRLEYVDGDPRIVLERSNRAVVRLSPQVREVPLPSPIPVIPRQALNAFLITNRMVDRQEYETAAYILSSTTGNLLMGAGHEIYVRGQWPGTASAYDVFRLGSAYLDPVTREPLGQEAINIGAINILSDEGGGIKKALITGSKEELKAGDRLLPKATGALAANFLPTPPEVDVSGVIIGLMNNESQAAQYEAVVFNLGTRDGLKSGDLLSIYRSGRLLRDPVTGESVSLPEAEIGLLLTYQAFEKLSYGVILSLTQPSLVGDTLRSH
jgi:hypothetical protein